MNWEAWKNGYNKYHIIAMKKGIPIGPDSAFQWFDLLLVTDFVKAIK